MAPEQISVLLAGGLWLGYLLFKAMKTNRAHKQREQALAENLAGREPKALIEASPFSYANWQGEDGYRIIDERKDPPFIGFAGTPEQAENQILLLIFAESERE